MNFKKIFVVAVVIFIIFGCSKKNTIKKEEIKNNINKTAEKIVESKEKIIKSVKDINKKAEKLIENKTDILKKGKEKAKENKSRLWEIYNETRKNIKEAKLQERYTDLIKLLKKQSEIAEKLGRKDIEAWQLNNIGYYSIEEFKKKINYDETMAKIYSVKDKKKRKKIYDEMIKKMKKNYKLLEKSYPYLKKAKIISEENDDKKQKKVIANNIAFINDIKKMIEKAEKQ
jgi:hypothetical protein